jgi:hypothetical protein
MCALKRGIEEGRLSSESEKFFWRVPICEQRGLSRLDGADDCEALRFEFADEGFEFEFTGAETFVGERERGAGIDRGEGLDICSRRRKEAGDFKRGTRNSEFEKIVTGRILLSAFRAPGSAFGISPPPAVGGYGGDDAHPGALRLFEQGAEECCRHRGHVHGED